jgi:hypothetical protein
MGHSTRQGDGVERLLFEGVFDRPLTVTFDGERQSDFGGLPLLAVLDRRLGLSAAVARAVRDLRQQGKVEHDVLEMVRQRIYGLAVGLEDVRDAARLRQDPGVRLACGRPAEGEEGALASASVLCRFENAVRRPDLYRIGEALLETVVERERKRRRGRATRITIDLDPSEDPTYGQQEFTFYNAHYGNWCYLPVFAFVTFHDDRGREEPEQHLVAAILRPGNVPATLGAEGLLSRLVKRLRRAFPGTPLRARLDGGYAAGEFLDVLEDLGLEYMVNMASNERLKAMVEPLLAGIVRPMSEETGCTWHTYGELTYAAKSWRGERRIVVKAEVVRDPGRPEREGRDNPRFVVTNMRQDPQWLYEEGYCGRGNIENRIKELKDGLSIDRTSCTSFEANQVRVLLTAAAYVLMQELRRHVASLGDGRPQVTTLRERLLLLSARVVTSTRRLLVRLSHACPWRELWTRVALKAGAARA